MTSVHHYKCVGSDRGASYMYTKHISIDSKCGEGKENESRKKMYDDMRHKLMFMRGWSLSAAVGRKGWEVVKGKASGKRKWGNVKSDEFLIIFTLLHIAHSTTFIFILVEQQFHWKCALLLARSHSPEQPFHVHDMCRYSLLLLLVLLLCVQNTHAKREQRQRCNQV